MVKPAWIAVALLVTASFAAAQSPAALLALPTAAADQTLHYGSDPLQFGELRLPKHGPAGKIPVVLIVHGGCWVDHLPGAPTAITTYQLLKPLAAALTDGGVATWNIEYRRSGSPGGGWPTTFQDVAAATDYLRKIAATYNLDLSRVTVVGHSSGGQLALWLAARSKLSKTSKLFVREPLAIRQVVDVDGPPDLAAAEPVEMQFCPVHGIRELLGGSPDAQPARYHDGSATAFLPLKVPQTIIAAGLLQHAGTLAKDYQAAAASKGDSVKIVPLQGGHFDMLSPTSAPGKLLLVTIFEAVNSKDSIPKK